MYANQYYNKIKELTDNELVSMVTLEPQNFDPLAINAAMAELSRRGIGEDECDEIKQDIIFQIIHKKEIEEEQESLSRIPMLFSIFPLGHVVGALTKAFISRKKE